MVILTSLLLLLIQPPADTLRILPDVVLDATRAGYSEQSAPYAVFRAERTDAQRLSQPVQGLDRLLQTFPGLQIQNRETLALGERIQIRGMGWRSPFGVRGITVILDGIPLTAPDGQTILEVIDPQSITSVELIRGPTAIQWGSGSGGTLLLSTKLDEKATVAQLGISANDARTVHLTGGDADHNGYASFHTTDGFRRHSQQSAYRFGMVSRWGPTRAILHGAFVPWADNPGPLDAATAASNPTSVFPLQQDRSAGKSFFHLQGGTRVDVPWGDITAYTTFRTVTNPLIANIVDLTRFSGGFRYDAPQIGRLRVGVDAAFQNDDRQSHTNVGGDGGFSRGTLTIDQRENWFGLTPYATHTLTLGNWLVESGVRIDLLRVSAGSTYDLLIPNASLGVSRAFRGATWFANVRTGSEAPTLNELSNSGVPTLNPESTVGAETGLRAVLFNAMFVDLAAYRMRVSERITPFQTAEGGDRTFFRNSGEAMHEGVEGALTILFSEEVRFTSSVQSNRFRFRNGNRIPGLAEFVATSSLQIRSNGFTVAAELISVGDQYANEVNTLRNAARTTGDLSIAKAFDVEEGQFVVSVRVQNLTDARYNGSVVVNPFNARAFEPAPGRMGVVTVGYRF
jgi:iron complex outermembrane receptor protein